MSPVYEVQTPNRRLDSWKEIAAFFGRDERTVKRWEKERALPVHRLPGGSRSRVFAYTDELNRWMRSLDSATREAIASENDPELEPRSGPEVDVVESLRRSDFAGPRNPLSRRRTTMLGALLCVALAAVGALAYHGYVSRLVPGNTSPASTSPKAPARVDPEAQQLYLQGRYYWNKRTPADLNKAVDYFTQAIVHDPNYAQAYVGLADCYNLLREFAAMPAEDAYPRALAAAKKAVELDDTLAEAHTSLAFVTFYWSWDIVKAEREFRRAIELNPNYVPAHHWYATFLLTLGRFSDALQQINQAQELDPSSTAILADKALILFLNGHTNEANKLLKQIEASQPGFFSTHQYLAYIDLENGDYEGYLAEAMKAAQLSHNDRELATVRAAAQGYKSGGEQGMMQSALEMEKKLHQQGQMSAFRVAERAARLGKKKEAMQYLQASYRNHEPQFVSVSISRELTSLHHDPAYRQLVMQAGFPLPAE